MRVPAIMLGILVLLAGLIAVLSGPDPGSENHKRSVAHRQQASAEPDEEVANKEKSASREDRPQVSTSARTHRPPRRSAPGALPYILGFLASLVGWYLGRVVSHSLLTGYYLLGWTVGITRGVVRSAIAIVASLGLFLLTAEPESFSWTPLGVAIAYPALCGLVAKKNPDLSEITHREVTMATAFGPVPRSEEGRLRGNISESVDRERQWGWGEFLGCAVVIALAAIGWYALGTAA